MITLNVYWVLFLLYQSVRKSSLNQVQQAEYDAVHYVDLHAHCVVVFYVQQQHIHSIHVLSRISFTFKAQTIQYDLIT